MKLNGDICTETHLITHTHTHTSLSLSIYIFIYIYRKNIPGTAKTTMMNPKPLNWEIWRFGLQLHKGKGGVPGEAPKDSVWGGFFGKP